MNINFYINPPHTHTHTQSPIEIWGQNVQGEKRPEGAKRPGAKRPGAKRLGEEMDLGRNVPEPSKNNTPHGRYTHAQKQCEKGLFDI